MKKKEDKREGEKVGDGRKRTKEEQREKHRREMERERDGPTDFLGYLFLDKSWTNLTIIQIATIFSAVIFFLFSILEESATTDLPAETSSTRRTLAFKSALFNFLFW